MRQSGKTEHKLSIWRNCEVGGGGSNNNIVVMLEKVKLDQLTEISLSEMICQEINENKLKTNKQFKKGWQGDRQNQNSRC